MRIQGLDLYGRADHLQRTPEPITPWVRVQMFLRAAYLLLVFLPFMLLGPLLLYLGYITARTPQGAGPGPFQAGISCNTDDA